MKSATRQAIDDYVYRRIPTGGFLYAVLSNNLCESIFRADSENLRDLEEIVRYIWENIPYRCWGSKGRVEDWLEGGEEEQV